MKPSASPFGAPVLLIPKPGSPGKLILVIDYGAVNALCQSDKYPVSTIEELIGQMSGAKYFTTLDLLNGVWQQPVLEAHKERISMTITMFGQFLWEVMPMGLTHSPAQFQRAMAELARHLPFCSCYVDDLIIWSTTMEEHYSHARQVMQRLASRNVSKTQTYITFIEDVVDNLVGEIEEEAEAKDNTETDDVPNSMIT